MARRFIVVASLMACVLVAAVSVASAAEDVLRLVPESACGLVVIKQPGAVDARLQALAAEMQLPLPSPLALLKQLCGIREGLDEQGTIAAVVPAEEKFPGPTWILLVPVTDYDKFIRPWQPGDVKDGVTTVQVMNHALCVRQVGGYAALSDELHRDTLATTIKIADEVPATLAPWRKWLDARDIAGVILSPGIKRASAKGQEALQMVKGMMAQAGGDQAKMASNGFDIHEKILAAVERECSACGVGLQLDTHNVLRLTSRALPVAGGNLADFLAEVKPTKENLLAGLPDEPFVLAGGMALSEAMLDAIKRLSVDSMKSMPDAYGLSEEQVHKMMEMTTQAFKGARAMSGMLVVGQSGQPMYANLLGTMHVDDAPAYLASYKEWAKQYSEFVKDVNSPILQSWELEESKVGGNPALQFTANMPQLPVVQENPQLSELTARMMEAYVGPGGKLVGWLTTVGADRVVLGYVNKDLMERTATKLAEKAAGLQDNTAVAKTIALLPPNSAVVAYLSPSGAIELGKRMASLFAPPAVRQSLNIPDFPQTPPLGFAVVVASNNLHTCLAVPPEVLKAAGQYAGKMMMQGGMPGGGAGVSMPTNMAPPGQSTPPKPKQRQRKEKER